MFSLFLFVLTQKITTAWRVSLDSLVAPCFALVWLSLVLEKTGELFS